MKLMRERIVRFATEESSWGYCRLEAAMKNLGHNVGPSTIANAYAERFVRSIKNACSNGMILRGERPLRLAIDP